MSIRRSFVLTAGAAVLSLSGLVPGTAIAAPITATTVCVSDAQAAEFKDLVTQARGIWNGAEKNVQLSNCSGGIKVIAKDKLPGGSYYTGDGHGHGTVYLDRSQIAQVYGLRLVTHEIGHGLGLGDTYDGPCSDLMSGGRNSEGAACRNAQPSAAERAEVDQRWANGYGAPQQRDSFTAVYAG
ncbi:snapalysin family zinc-dependent metalloprotease [Pseudonocardiaceae bacterium YIM PH 21723]|nr:snapalysin family zinc-dependent metalloprotease [Pseudonocardiaceae bacterium YIM PH 21723]